MSGSVNIDELERLLEKAGALDAKFVKAHDIHGKPTKGLLLRNGTMGMPATFANPNEAELYATLRNAAPSLIAEIKRLREALEPLARLEVPTKPQGNAGAYSIFHNDIRRAKAALNGDTDWERGDFRDVDNCPPGDTP